MEDRTELGSFSVEQGKVRQLLLVTPDLLPQVWPQVEQSFIENENVWGEHYTLEAFPSLFEQGILQLWTMNDEDEFILVMVTELRIFPKVKVLNILLLFGREFKDALQFSDYVELWASKQGATTSMVFGRKGFVRWLKPYGYEEKATVLCKDISGMVEH